jgi:hypothetical protein
MRRGTFTFRASICKYSYSRTYVEDLLPWKGTSLYCSCSVIIRYTLLMCSKSLHCIIQNTNHQQMHKESFIVIVTHSYMFRTPEVLPEDDPAGSKHVGVCYDDGKTLFVHLLVVSVLYVILSWMHVKLAGPGLKH